MDQPKILLVDDEVAFTDAVATFLRASHYTVLVASTGKQTLDLLLRHRPQLLLMDLKLPDMHGLELVQQVKSVSPNTQVVVITAYQDDGGLKEKLIKQLGVAAYLHKPLSSLMDLAALVKAALENKREMPMSAVPQSAMWPRLQGLVAKQLGVEQEKVTPEARLEELGADSLDAVELTMALEEEFQIEIPEEDIERMQRIGDLIPYLEQKQQKDL